MRRGKYVENGKIVFLTFNNVYDGRQKYVIQKNVSSEHKDVFIKATFQTRF